MLIEPVLILSTLNVNIWEVSRYVKEILLNYEIRLKFYMCSNARESERERGIYLNVLLYTDIRLWMQQPKPWHSVRTGFWGHTVLSWNLWVSHTHPHTNTHTITYKHTYIHTHTHVHTHTYTYAWILTMKHTHIYISLSHTYMCMPM